MSAPSREPHGLYVHVPWCRRRCPYCAFYVEVDREVPWEGFVDALLREHRLRAPLFGERAATVFLGGGTPSRLPPASLRRLLDGLPRIAGAEVTVETNPEDATPAWLDAALDAGITRISLGVQTFDRRFARLLNRASTVEQAKATARRVASAGFASWSVDLIFALPGQTVQDLAVDLDAILATGPPHVSLYGLTFEPGTPFGRAEAQGRLTGPDDETWRAMYDDLVERLAIAGYRRYEVSNFARPGHESRHNRLYWTDAPYLGLGPSAHSYAPDGRRWVNVADAASYLTLDDPIAEEERPDPEQAATDLLLSGLRGVDGVSLARLAARTGLAPGPTDHLERAGLITRTPERIALAPGGFPVADSVVLALSKHLVPAVVPPADPPARAGAAIPH